VIVQVFIHVLSIVENHRIAGTGPDSKGMAQRTVLYLGEIDDSQQAAFRCLKSDLAIRPVHHQLEHRVEAHIFVAFLGHCLMVTLKNLLRPRAPGLTPWATA